MTMETIAIAGLAMRLVQRLEVRHEPTSASPAAASAAAGTPCISSTRKMKISPAAKELVERGMRTGKKPASVAMAAPATICSSAARGSAATAPTQCSSTSTPMDTMVHQ